MTPKYRFFLQIGETGDKQPVNPNYKDDLALDYELETKQKFYRAKLSGKINFVRNDFDFINNAPFDSEFFLFIEKSNDWWQTYSQYYKAKFMKTDCTINNDDKIITVQPETTDQYDNVLAGLEKEYNLVELAPQIEFLTIRKRPLIQIYVPGDSIVSCFLGGTNWEQNVKQQVHGGNVLRNNYHFSVCSRVVEINVTANDGADNKYNGIYVGNVSYGNVSEGVYEEGTFVHENSNFKIKYQKASGIATSKERYSFYDGDNLYYYYKSNGFIENKTIKVYNYNGIVAGYLKFDINLKSIFARYLCDVETIDDVSTYEISSDDIVENNRNY